MNALTRVVLPNLLTLHSHPSHIVEIVIFIKNPFPPRKHNLAFIRLLLVQHVDQCNQLRVRDTLTDLVTACHHDEAVLEISGTRLLDHCYPAKTVGSLGGEDLGNY